MDFLKVVFGTSLFALLLLISGQPQNVTASSEEDLLPYQPTPACGWHNSREWHPLFDPGKNCYYDHEHKDNPGILYNGMPDAERAAAERMLAVFGPPGHWFGGTSISYPWQTFHGAGPNYGQPFDGVAKENGHKHGGYGWIVRTNLPQQGTEWISDFRLQYHAIFASVGATTRYHSFSLEANVCHTQHGCRIIRTGGWLDFGHLRVNGRYIPIGSQDGGSARQRLHRYYDRHEIGAYDHVNAPAFWYGMMIPPDKIGVQPWRWGEEAYPFRELRIALNTRDSWSSTNPTFPHEENLFCPDFNCNKNGSTVALHRMMIDAQAGAFNGYTDRFGKVNPDCTYPALDCIPTEIGEWTNPARTRVNYGDIGPPREYDTSPAGEFWIKYPN